MSKHDKKSKSTHNNLGDLLGDVDINEVLKLLSALLNKIDSKQQDENAKIRELMKDERFQNLISELRKEYNKKEDKNV